MNRRIDLGGKQKWRAPEPKSAAVLWGLSVSGNPWCKIRGHILVVSKILPDETSKHVDVYFKWGYKKDTRESQSGTWHFSQVYYQTIEEAKAAALFQVGIGPKSVDFELEVQPDGRAVTEPRIARRIVFPD